MIAAAVTAAGAPARSGECEAAGKVCLGTLPSSHARVVLRSRNGSSEQGVARITLGFHQTQVDFSLSGAPGGVRQTVNLLRGGCGGKVLLRLGSILNGKGVARGGPDRASLGIRDRRPRDHRRRRPDRRLRRGAAVRAEARLEPAELELGLAELDVDGRQRPCGQPFVESPSQLRRELVSRSCVLDHDLPVLLVRRDQVPAVAA